MRKYWGNKIAWNWVLSSSKWGVFISVNWKWALSDPKQTFYNGPTGRIEKKGIEVSKRSFQVRYKALILSQQRCWIWSGLQCSFSTWNMPYMGIEVFIKYFGSYWRSSICLIRKVVWYKIWSLMWYSVELLITRERHWWTQKRNFTTKKSKFSSLFRLLTEIPK